MAKVRFLVDTDITIDSLKGIKSAKELFHSADIDLIAATAWAKGLPLLTRKSAGAILPERPNSLTIQVLCG